MSISMKLKLTFVLIVLLVAGQSYLNSALIERAENVFHGNVLNGYNATNHLDALTIGINKARRFEKEYFIYVETPAKREKYFAEWASAVKESRTLLQSMKSETTGVFSDANQTEIDAWLGALAFYEQEFGKINSTIAVEDQKAAEASPLDTAKRSQNQDDATAVPVPNRTILANEAIKNGKDRLNIVFEQAARMHAEKIKAAQAAQAMMRDNLATTKTIANSAAYAVILISLMIMFTVPASIKRTIRAFVDSANVMSKGNVSTPMKLSVSGEFAPLAAALDRLRMAQLGMSERLRKKRPSETQDITIMVP